MCVGSGSAPLNDYSGTLKKWWNKLFKLSCALTQQAVTGYLQFAIAAIADNNNCFGCAIYNSVQIFMVVDNLLLIYNDGCRLAHCTK